MNRGSPNDKQQDIESKSYNDWINLTLFDYLWSLPFLFHILRTDWKCMLLLVAYWLRGKGGRGLMTKEWERRRAKIEIVVVDACLRDHQGLESVPGSPNTTNWALSGQTCLRTSLFLSQPWRKPKSRRPQAPRKKKLRFGHFLFFGTSYICLGSFIFAAAK